MNTVVVGFNDAGLDIDNSATWTQANAENLLLESLHLANATNFKDDDDDIEAGDYVEDIFNLTGTNTLDQIVLVDPYNLSAPNFALSEVGTASAVDASTVDGWFDATDFVGAVGDTDWTLGWTTSETN